MQDNELDRILDSALAGYAGAEPRRGLERRVVDQIRAQRPSARWFRALGYAAAVAVLLIGIAVRPRDSQLPKILVASLVPPAPVEVVAQAPALSVMQHRLRRKSDVPRQPAPLTRLERALVASVQNYPKQVEDALVSLRLRNDEPIEIQAIQIPPLNLEGGQ